MTGLWGIVFLMSWLASVVNWAWVQGFAWSKVRPGLLLYGGLLALVFVGGGARLAFFAPQGPTVRVVGITALRARPLPPRPWDEEAQAQVFFTWKATEALIAASSSRSCSSSTIRRSRAVKKTWRKRSRSGRIHSS